MITRTDMCLKLGSKHDTANEESRVFRIDLHHNGAVCSLEALLTRTGESRHLDLFLQITCSKNGANHELH